jgi:hypothetical protein
LNLSAKGKNEIKPSNPHSNQNINVKSINLPKLDRIITKGSSSKAGNGIYLQHPHPLLQPKPSKVDITEMLKIEGKSNNPRYNYEYEI